MIATGPDWELRLGRWQDELADVECDAIICDPPYGARVHEDRITDTSRYDGSSAKNLGPAGHYEAWTPEHVAEFVDAWSSRCRGWMVAMTSHDLVPAWERAYADADRYCFAPIPLVMRGMTVRLAGDGPSNWTVWGIVARPRSKEFATWGTLDGYYGGPRPEPNQSGGSKAGSGRGKPAWLMNALVRDYSRPGDTICDPFAGWGSALAAAVANGRTAIGAEMDKDAFNEAVRRLNRPTQVDLFGGAA